MESFSCRVQYLDDTDPFSSTNFPEPTRPPTFSFLTNVPMINQIAGVHRLLRPPHRLDDCALQLYKHAGHGAGYGTYLDLESSLEEQWDEMEGFTDDRKNALLLRTQLSVRVHACIEKLLNSSGRELRRALFSLKQIFQDDQDLVHEFVQNDGLECLVKVGAEADQNYQNYILRALGQVMLYVDGMNGIIEHNGTVQWLYSLLSSRFRLVVKTSLKLMLVFVEYTESNAQLLIQAVNQVDASRGTSPWSNFIDILDEKDGGDTELLVFAMTLLNKVLGAVPDEDTFYDVTDALEEQEMERIAYKLSQRRGAEGLQEQLTLYDAALREQDGDEEPTHQAGSLRRISRVKSEGVERKSRRYSEVAQPDVSGRLVRGRKEERESSIRLGSRSAETSTGDHRAHFEDNSSGSKYRTAEDSALTVTSPRPESVRVQREPESSTMQYKQTACASRDAYSQRSSDVSSTRAIERPTSSSSLPRVSEELNSCDKSRNNDSGSRTDAKEQHLERQPSSNQLRASTIAQQHAHTPVASVIEELRLRREARRKQHERQRGQQAELQDTRAPLSRTVEERLAAREEKSYGRRASREQLLRQTCDPVSRTDQCPEQRQRVSCSREDTARIPTNGEPPKDFSKSPSFQASAGSNQEMSFSRHHVGKDPLPKSKTLTISEETQFSEEQHSHQQRATSLGSPGDTQSSIFKARAELNLRTSRNRPEEFTRDEGFQDKDALSVDSIASNLSVVSRDSGVSERLHGASDEETERFSLRSADPPRGSHSERQDPGELARKGAMQPDGSAEPRSTDHSLSVRRSSENSADRRGSDLSERHNSEQGRRGSAEGRSNAPGISNNKRWMLAMMYSRSQEDELEPTPQAEGRGTAGSDVRSIGARFYSGTVRSRSPSPSSSTEGLAEQIGQARASIERRASNQRLLQQSEIVQEVRRSESDVQWETLQRQLSRALRIGDLDFTDLTLSDDEDVLEARDTVDCMAPPPPPPIMVLPSSTSGTPSVPPPPPLMSAPPPPPPPTNNSSPANTLSRGRKMVKLHWREVKDQIVLPGRGSLDTIWRQLDKVKIDTKKLEHVFETRSTDAKNKVQDSHKKQITVLDTKRSNAINIGLTVFPPPRTIKAAILNMDSNIVNREGIERLLTVMTPSEEEKARILEAQLEQPDLPLGSAEQFLLTLSSISELRARLSLWAFKVDYEIIEQEVADPLMDLKQGLESLQQSQTFRYVLAVIREIGSFLNGHQTMAFHINYLSRVPEVKDTVHKHSLLHHVCHMVMDQFSDSTDLYSEVPGLTRCAKVEWDELSTKITKMETDCKASWDHLRAIVKHDNSSQLKIKMSDFLADSAERIMVLKIVYARVISRYHRLLVYLGMPPNTAREMHVGDFCRIISEFALEYRTTREKVMQQIKKRENLRERKRTRGKTILDSKNFKEDKELQKVLANGTAHSPAPEGDPSTIENQPVKVGGTTSLRRVRKSDRFSTSTRSSGLDTSEEGGDDAMLDAFVKSASAPTSRAPRERRRAGNRQRKSLRRTLKSGLTPEEQAALLAYNQRS